MHGPPDVNCPFSCPATLEHCILFNAPLSRLLTFCRLDFVYAAYSDLGKLGPGLLYLRIDMLDVCRGKVRSLAFRCKCQIARCRVGLVLSLTALD